MNSDGTPKMAHGAVGRTGSYWKDGMKLGYQDAARSRC